MNLGLPETVLIFAVAFLLLGPDKLPEVARSVGKGLREFKRALRSVEDYRPDSAGGASQAEQASREEHQDDGPA